MAEATQNIEHFDALTSNGAGHLQSSAPKHDDETNRQTHSDTNNTPASNSQHRAVISLIENIASEDPTRPFTYIPVSSDPKDGWKAVTFEQLAHAIDYLAHNISKSTVNSNNEFPTVAYIGPNDVRYPMMLLACIKSSCKALFISPRNTTAVQLSLFEATDCDSLYYAESFKSIMKPCLDRRTIEAVTIDSVDHLLGVTPTRFPYSRSAEQARWDPLVVLHTSGSTGIPKPIFVRQGMLSSFDTLQKLPKYQDSTFIFSEWAERASRVFIAMPMFHAAGSYSTIASIYLGLPTAMPLPNKPMSVDTALDCLTHAGVDGALLPPSVVEGLSASEEGVDVLTKLSFVAFAGGNLSPVAGNSLVERGAILNNLIASTEFFPYASYFPTDPKLWQYFIFDSQVMGINWRPYSSDGYELVVRRNDPVDPGVQSCFYTFPELSEWSTKDIFQPHPTLKDHWLYKCRADDVIVFSNGEKLNPVSIEARVTGHPLVKGAIVVGQDKFQAALILEPVPDALPKNDTEAKQYIESVWPLIEKANAETVGHGRIARNFVTVADPALPFLRAGKGTVQRASTLKLYRDFIESLYEKADAPCEGNAPIDLDLGDGQALTQFIIHLFQDKLGVDGLEPNTDFFSAGVDSLQVMTASNLLKFALQGAGVDATTITPRVIYRYPTPKDLAAYILSIQNGSADQDEEAKEVKETEQLVSKYTENLPKPRTGKQEPSSTDQTIVITGTTGSLGAYMLDRVCKLPSVKKVIALNRGEDGGLSRQPSVSESRGLATDFSKVEFLQSDLSLPDLGLGQPRYNALLASVDRIIHNAWPVNFNISVSSFESSICGVRHLVDFSSTAAKSVPIIFISSIGVADGWSSSDSVPEQALHDMSLPQMGYGRSKLAGSLILDAAAEKSGVPTASVRVGQIAGPRGEKGIWNRQEFIPSLIASSVYLGALPNHLGTQQEVTWTPVEDIAGLILDIAGVTAPKPVSEISGYFHGVNPTAVDWSKLAPAVKDFYGDRMKIVSLEDWVERLEASEKEKDMAVEKNPGVKLLDTYRALLEAKKQGQTMRFSMNKTQSHSPTIRQAGPITSELIRNWCRQWGY
ncbi:hypothetical protein BFJ68_g15631 [Fusarium oxysporum]|uniref:Uncharacterized protein n=1 Tax=Fusarium oxysporum TaxID=5507 RepID=A0A420NST4_FUSOX|nr:hypothetical protein BFJ71_g14945 [Fusarium oxysporum]RKK93238.1 hypothetical protein BFJ68_g15631 [Fusarium oxysporum]